MQWWPLAAFLSPFLVLVSCERADELIFAKDDFEIHPDFNFELVAGEPQVLDPVAMEIDEKGNFYVVEMPGYPLDVTGSGRIKMLKDQDSDGFFESSVLFAEGLVLPNGIMRWKKGVIVTDAPDVLYLEDTDGDDRADVREVLLTGFSRSNPQHNMNTPKYGLDNWIYLGHEGAFITKTFEKEFGDMGTEIFFPNLTQSERLPKNANNRSVRFKVDGHLEMLSARTQFGYTFDDFGARFTTNNHRHLYHEVIASKYLANKQIDILESPLQYLPSTGPGDGIYPITENPEHQLLTDVGVMTSACAITMYQGGQFPGVFNRVCFTAEPVHNLVHADVISDRGATYSSRPLRAQNEFFRSKDSWFRPVNFYIGPLGSLYVIDYHRQFIEHPEWMAKEVVESGQLYQGNDKGRIYRISSANFQKKLSDIRWGDMTTTEWIQSLASPNIWWRRNAQRLLLDMPGHEIEPSLVSFAGSTSSPIGLVHAMWTLQGLDGCPDDLLEKALHHQVAGVRLTGLRIISEQDTLHQTWVSRVALLADDPDAKVRFEVLSLLSSSPSKKSFDAQQKILSRDLSDPWVQMMVLISLGERRVAVIDDVLQAKENPATLSFIKTASQTVAKSSDKTDIKHILGLVKHLRSSRPEYAAALLSGLTAGLDKPRLDLDYEPYRTDLYRTFSRSTDPDIRSKALDLLGMLGLPKNQDLALVEEARKALTQPGGDPDFKLDALSFLALHGSEDYHDIFASYLSPRVPLILQKRAIQALGASSWENFKFSDFVRSHWHAWTGGLRQEALDLLISSEAGTRFVLDALENGIIAKSAIRWSHEFRLLNHRQGDIRSRARSLLVPDPEDELQLIAAHREVLNSPGDRHRGKDVFSVHCSRCHQINEADGVHFGPDLGAIRNRTKASLLQDILLPNHAIADGYATASISMTDGTQHLGIIADESNQFIQLRDATGQLSRIDRQGIETIKTLKQSAMPTGLHDVITKSQLADLLAYLKRPYH